MSEPKASDPVFDAVLLISFGGPQGLDDIRPFLANVLRGRRIPPERVEEVAHHYELFGGVSPLTAYTERQAEGLRQRLAAAGTPLPVYIGMRNWNPYLADTLADMSRAGVKRAIGFILAAQSSYSSCEQYKENVLDARQAIRNQGLRDVEITYVEGWHTHADFIATNAAHVRDAAAGAPRRCARDLHRAQHSDGDGSALEVRRAAPRQRPRGRTCGGHRRLDARVPKPQRPSAGSVA
jgi:ferrochelatase